MIWGEEKVCLILYNSDFITDGIAVSNTISNITDGRAISIVVGKIKSNTNTMTKPSLRSSGLYLFMMVRYRWKGHRQQDKPTEVSVGTKPSFLGAQFLSIFWLELLNANESRLYL